jgi:hypothetical protein
MAKLSKAAAQLREQIDDDFPSRSRKSDGWIADPRHFANNPSSDHIPRNGIVRAIDIDADLADHPEATYALVEQIRKCAKRGDKRIKYIIYDGKIMSPILNWKRRRYRGSNPHRSHFHVSFTTLGDNNGKWFDLEGERQNAKRFKKGSGELDQDISSSSPSDLPRSRPRCECNCQCRNSISLA